MMKKILILLAAALMCVNVCDAKNKVVDKSAKKAPEWMCGAVEGFLTVTVEGENLPQAQSRALETLAETIINSVAMNVSSSTTSAISLENKNGDVQESENFSKVSRLRSANLPFLQGLSLANVEDFYWVKMRGDNGREWVEYSILYPFTAQDLADLQIQFKEIDSANMQTLLDLDDIDTAISGTDDIKRGISKLEELEAYFFDDVRLKQVSSLKSLYRGLYKDLTLTCSDPVNGVYHIGAALRGRPIKLATKPKATSECATQIRLNPSGDGFDMKCNTEDCLPEELNSVNLTVRIDGNKYNLEVPLTPGN